MNTRPFLFLDSPNVEGIGHAYVVSTGEQLPPDGELRRIATSARNDESQRDFIAASRKVVQVKSGRDAREFLICAGASTIGQVSLVQEVLAELLAAHVSPDKLVVGSLQQSGGSGIFSALLLNEMETAFFADARIQAVHWKNPAPPHSPRPERPAIKLMIKIIGVAFLIFLGVGIWQVCKAIDWPRPPGNSPSENPKTSGSAPDSWGFLKNEGWTKILMANGYELSAPRSSREAWAKAFAHEFKIETPSPNVIEKADISSILLRSQPEPSNWFRNYKNQRSLYPDIIRTDAEKIENFSDLFPSQPEKDKLSGKLSKIWQVLKTIPPPAEMDEADWKGLQQMIAQQMKGELSGYRLFTLRDAERIDRIKKVLGSAEIGIALRLYKYGQSETEWIKILDRLRDAHPKSTLAPTLQQIFELSSSK